MSCDRNSVRVLFSDLSDTEITVMIAIQRASLWGSHPLAKHEAILRCLMIKRLGDNIDHAVLSTLHCAAAQAKSQSRVVTWSCKTTDNRTSDENKADCLRSTLKYCS